jgi:DNA polymerase-1
MQALIDADILAYQAASTSERPVKWDEDLWTLHAFESEAQEHFHDMVLNITAKAECEDAVLVWTDSENWRKSVLPTYKSNRAGVRKPLVLSPLRKWAQEKYESRIIPTLEGDDVLGLMATDPDIESKVVVCSLDKDLKTIPGNHYNFGKDEHFTVTTHQANMYHMYQTLIGDATDGYKGCPGVGPVAAQKIIDSVNEQSTPWASESTFVALLWEAVVKAYKKAGLGEEEALCQARVARILRHGEYGFKSQMVNLWTPPVLLQAA